MKMSDGVSAKYPDSDARAGRSLDIVVLGAIWIITACIVNPSGNFPLNDDWAYALTVRHFIDSGDYRPLENTTMALVTNVIWGSLFCLSASFDFLVLRLSTLVAAFLGISGVYLFVREFRQSRRLALCAALVVEFNPIYFSLSFTFMTDVLFVTLCLWACLFFSRNLRTNAPLDCALGTALALAATFSRQLAICIPLAFCLIRLLVPQPRVPKVLTAMTPPLICVAALVGFLNWLRATGKLPALFGIQTNQIVQSFTSIKALMLNIWENAFVSSAYLGLFLFPLLVLSIPSLVQARTIRRHVSIGIGLLFVVAGVCVRIRAGLPISMPLSSNIIIGSGIGPLTLRDTYLLQLTNIPALPVSFWRIVTLISLIGSVLLISRLIVEFLDIAEALLANHHLERGKSYSPLLLLCGAVYLFPLLLLPSIFDRYLIPIAIFLMLSNVTTVFDRSQHALTHVPMLVLAYTVIGAFCLFSITGTHDYLAWNRLRWNALRDLTRLNRVPATEIDGGYEFNGLLLYDPNYDVIAHLNDAKKSFWWVHNDTYMIAFGPVPGYRVIRQYMDRSWLEKSHRIVVLRKDELAR